MSADRDPDIAPEGTAPEWVYSLGIIDLETAIQLAKTTEKLVHDAAKTVLAANPRASVASMVLLGFVARAQGFGKGVITGIATNNPYVAFTLIRSYFENTAAMLYVIDKPKELDRLWGTAPNSHGVSIGKITNHSVKRFAQAKGTYDVLSKYAHPHSMSLVASMQLDGNDFSWQSAPTFRTPDEALVAAGLLLQLANATVSLIHEYASKHLREE
ncbi:hypothetical protein [Nocardia sp. NPDC005366]|uniref:hypothetical protein n=1 Tax=Nocardia sp. NPDC005366 TaxID=3156878 RepID=UPI0033B88E20